MLIKRILVVIRLMENTRVALQQGYSLARQFGAELSVLRVYSAPKKMGSVNVPGLLLGEKHDLSIPDQFKEQLDAAVHEVIGDSFPIKEYITDKDPNDEIIRIVEEEKIDLLAVLAHEEGLLEHFIFGGLHDTIIRKLPCSVILIKSDKK